jgi:uncharacterized membrane protein
MKTVKKSYFADKDIQVILGTLLRVGVILSMSVVFVGAVLYLINNSYHLVDYAEFKPGSGNYSSMAQVWAGLKAHDGAAIIQMGTLLLIFTPITRVVFSVFSFLIERDYLYVVIGMFVLSVILFSLSNKLVG